MSIQFWFIGMIVMSIVTIDALPFIGSLTDEGCKACSYRFACFFFFFNFFVFVLLDFASNDVNKQIHAYFNCPKKLRPKHKIIERNVVKRSLILNDDQQNNLPIFG